MLLNEALKQNPEIGSKPMGERSIFYVIWIKEPFANTLKMIKKSSTIPSVFVGFIFLGLLISCGKESELGGCSVSCGGFRTGQPFVQTNHRFISEADCITKGEEAGPNCKASYCPPTGDSDDCYQVWP